MRKLGIIIFIIMTFLSACGPTNIDNLDRKKISFESLPDTVQKIYEIEANKRNIDFTYTVISTDQNISFEHEYTGMDDGIWTLMTRGFKHHFYIDGKHFALQANQGNPFVLDKNHLTIL